MIFVTKFVEHNHLHIKTKKIKVTNKRSVYHSILCIHIFPSNALCAQPFKIFFFLKLRKRNQINKILLIYPVLYALSQ